MPADLVLVPAAGKGSVEQELTALVLDGVTSEHSKRAYQREYCNPASRIEVAPKALKDRLSLLDTQILVVWKSSTNRRRRR